MVITKKDQILKLYDEGYKIDDIIKEGFTKKYINQVLKKLKISISTKTDTDNSSMAELKQLVSTVENLKRKYDGLNINIDITIKVDGYNNSSSEVKTPLLNPVTTFRDIGGDGLKDKLIAFSLKDLIKIARAYTPDLSCSIYRKKDVNIIIQYIIQRADSLSKLGQVFRNVTKKK